MNFDKNKIAYAISVVNQIIIDGERYYIDDWTNALHYTKNVLESHLNGVNDSVEGIDAIIREINHTKTVMEETKKLYDSQSSNDDDQHGDNIHW